MAGYVNARLNYDILEEIAQYATDSTKYAKVRLHFPQNKGHCQGLAKTLKNPEHQPDVEHFETQRAIHRNLDHKNILAFIGDYFSPEDKDFTIITEFPNGGSLNEFLNSQTDPLPSRQVLSFALQSSTAIEYIQTKDILHQDIKSHNFYLVAPRRGNPVLKLSGFGFSKVSVHSTKIYLTEDIRGSRFRWQSPEALIRNQVSKKSDIYSLHIVFWELITRKKPYERQRNTMSLMRFIQSADENRPRIPDHCPPRFREVIERGWVTNPEDRPTITEVKQQLEIIERE